MLLSIVIWVVNVFFTALKKERLILSEGRGMEGKQSQGRRKLFYPPYVCICISMHFFLSLCYCLVVDITEANAIVFLLKPGTISLFFLFIPIKARSVRMLVVFVSIVITFIFNQWPLATGNKTLVLCVQVAWFIACWSTTAVNKSGWLMMSVALFLLCIWGVIRQERIKQQFNTADIYIVNDGVSCGANGHCFQYIAAQGYGLTAKRQTIFSSENYVNIYYSYPEGVPAVNFDGMNGEFSQYLLCHGRLTHVEHNNMAVCN